jgi:hypothetical protein
LGAGWATAASANDGVGGVVITAYFLLGGVLFSTLGWRSQTANAAPSPLPARDRTL